MAAAGGAWSKGGKFIAAKNKGAVKAIKTARNRTTTKQGIKLKTTKQGYARLRKLLPGF